MTPCHLMHFSTATRAGIFFFFSKSEGAKGRSDREGVEEEGKWRECVEGEGKWKEGGQ